MALFSLRGGDGRPSTESRAYVEVLLKLDSVMLAVGQTYLRAADEATDELIIHLRSDEVLPPDLKQELETRAAELKSCLRKLFTDEGRGDYRDVLFLSHRMSEYIGQYVRG